MRKKKRIILNLFVGLLVMISALGVFSNLDLLGQNPLSNTILWASPSFVGAFEQGSLVIDNSKTRVSLLDDQQEITVMLNGGSQHEQRFFYAENAVINATGIYLVDVRYAENGTRVERERVLHYTTSGDFRGVVFEQSYTGDEMPLQYGNILYLGATEQEVCFLVKNQQEITVMKVQEGVAVSEGSCSIADVPPIWCVTYDLSEETIWLTTKTGEVYHYEPALESWSLLPLQESLQEGSIIRDIAILDGQIFCTDLGGHRLLNLSTGESLLAPESDLENAPIYYRLNASERILSTTDNMEIITMDPKGQILTRHEGASYASSYRLRLFAVVAAVLVLMISAVIAGVFLLRFLLTSKHSKTAFLFAVVIIISTVFVSSGILTVMFDRLNEKTTTQLRQTAEVASRLSGQTFGDALASIDSLGDYGGEDYNTLRDYLDPYCDSAYATGSNMYYVVYQVVDGQLYGVADYENTTGTRYPYGQYADSDYEKVFADGEIISVGSENSAYGSFSFVMAPIYNAQGEAVGIVEFGINQFSETLKNRALIFDIALSTAVIVFILLLVLTEGTVLVSCISQRREHPTSTAPIFLRPMVFLTFFTSNLSAAFMPTLSARLVEGFGGFIPQNLGSALPMSVELFFVAIFAFFCGGLMDRVGLKKIMLMAVITQVAGHLSTAVSVFTSNYPLFLLGRMLTGAGIGILVVAFNAMPNAVATEEEREGLYAQLNAGLISGVVISSSMGTYFANWWGYSAVFVVAAFFMLPIAGLVFYTVSNESQERNLPIDNALSMSVVKFITKRQVITFLMLIMAPFLVIMYFKDYLFPLFAVENGYTDVSIGNILLFSGVLSIYLGPSVSAWLFRHIGRNGVLILSSGIFALTMVVFGLYPTPTVATVVVFVISFVAGFGLTGQSVYFSSLPTFSTYGVNRSMSVYSLWDNVAQTIGPILFGALLFLGYGGASLAIGIVATLLLLFFVATGLKGEEKNG